MLPSVDSPLPAAAVRVIVAVRGGVAEAICKPKGIEMLIFDYDVDGAAPVDRDPDGVPCTICTCPAHEKLSANKHWPIVRTAAKKLSERHPPHTHQRWRCPQCQRTIHANPASLADVGTPSCPQCACEMDVC